MFATLRARREKAMGLFLTGGFPDPESTLELLKVIDEAGADFIELGMPFSDPLAEGVPIQRASERALRHGIRLVDVLHMAEAFRSRSQTPLLLMGYVNPVYRYGMQAFCRDAAQAGVDGLILADLPPEESEALAEAAQEAGLAMVYLIAPNTPSERIQQIDALATGFVYAVSITGLTGSTLQSHEAIEAYLARARQLVTRNPLLVGFGIRSHEDALRLGRHTDGFIVGSALIRLVERLWDDAGLSLVDRLEAVQRFVHELKYGTSVPAS
ncbi:tryptophan synthase subunit alpha [Rhodothermus bifroesti]|nr:Tryptophan synthase alpha chain [bacterium HR18]